MKAYSYFSTLYLWPYIDTCFKHLKSHWHQKRFDKWTLLFTKAYIYILLESRNCKVFSGWNKLHNWASLVISNPTIWKLVCVLEPHFKQCRKKPFYAKTTKILSTPKQNITQKSVLIPMMLIFILGLRFDFQVSEKFSRAFLCSARHSIFSYIYIGGSLLAAFKSKFENKLNQGVSYFCL